MARYKGKGIYMQLDQYGLPVWNQPNGEKLYKDAKIRHLYELGHLNYPFRNRTYPDPLEAKVRMVLEECKTEQSVDRVLHDVIVGNCTLEEMLTLKGMMM